MVKICMLIIASYNYKVYSDCIKTWEKYMNNSEHVKCYFLLGDPNQPTNYSIHENKIITKSIENKVPGILTKTAMALQALSNEGELEQYDYIVRTNLSSFWILDRLIAHLEKKPRLNFIQAVHYKYKTGLTFPTGSGFILSKDITQLLLSNAPTLLEFGKRFPDDVAIGMLFAKLGKKINQARRYDFTDHTDKSKIDKSINTIPSNIYHIRVKNASLYRGKLDHIILNKLSKKFYNK